MVCPKRKALSGSPTACGLAAMESVPLEARHLPALFVVGVDALLPELFALVGIRPQVL